MPFVGIHRFSSLIASDIGRYNHTSKTVKCLFPCDIVLACGHRCDKGCSESHYCKTCVYGSVNYRDLLGSSSHEREAQPMRYLEKVKEVKKNTTKADTKLIDLDTIEKLIDID